LYANFRIYNQYLGRDKLAYVRNRENLLIEGHFIISLLQKETSNETQFNPFALYFLNSYNIWANSFI